ncbi:MAG: FHA domain-containing protein, partial [Opitutae bacterium]|nr:FHA domain-containing protein [Opitutae bacterium]
MYRLVFLSGRYEGKRLVVRQAVTLVGRDAECHLLLPDDATLAPRHARFEERGTGVFLSSLAPEHPVERNGAPVRDTLRLAHNDVLVLGQTRIQFQDIIAPHPRLRPNPGLLQPATLLLAAAILALELGLLAFLVDWPRHLIRPETETEDLARAQEIRALREAENAATGAVAKADASASVVTLPGTPPPAAPPRTNA